MADLVVILQKLLAADNNLISEGTKELEEAYNSPNTIPALCQIVVSDNEPHIRQYAAVLLRKRLGKLRNWRLVLPEHQQTIKNGMLNALLQEKEKNVRAAVAHLIGVIVRHESDKQDGWMNDVLKFIYSNCASANPVESELGSSTFATLTDVAPDQFVCHMDSVCQMFTCALAASDATGNVTSPTILNIIVGMTHLTPFVLGHNAAEQTYTKSIPTVVKALAAFAVLPDPEQFVTAFDILESMADYTPKLLTTNLKPLMEFCLQLAANTNLDPAVRIKVIVYIGWLVRLKKKAIVKQKLLEPIVQVIFHLMATNASPEDDDEEYFLGEDSTNPMTAAAQTMDMLALNIPSEKLIPQLLKLFEPALQSQEPYARRAAYLGMAVIAEGCAETICDRYLDAMLETVKNGILDQTPIVRNSAFFALGQFSEHLQPDIIKHAESILPILFKFLEQLCVELQVNNTEPKHVERMFYALETFCEKLETLLEPYLNELMLRLFETLNPKNSPLVRQLALSSVSAAANATKEKMMPYFPQLISILQPYLSKIEPGTEAQPKDHESEINLRGQAMDTLAALARTIGKENFQPLATETMGYALSLLQSTDDPEDTRASYNLIASMAAVVNEDMSTIYPQIMDRIFESVLSMDEIITESKDGDDERAEKIRNAGGDAENIDDDNYEEDIEDSDDEDDQADVAIQSLENAYLEEKEEAILALKEFAENTGAAFYPYLEPSFQNVYKIIDHPDEDIRKVCIDALFTFVKVLFKQQNTEGIKTAVGILVPKVVKMIIDDEEAGVVMCALESLTDMMAELKDVSLPSELLREKVYTAIVTVLSGKAACQFNDPTENDDSLDESDFDEALIECAGNMLPAFAKAMGPQQFSLYFGRIYPSIVQKLDKAKNDDEFKQHRSFAYGCLAECFEGLQQCTALYFDDLMPRFLKGLTDSYDQVRQNSVFGLGEMVYYAEEKSFGSYPVILQALSEHISKETTPGAIDNICGALARLIVTNIALVPLDTVLPVFLDHLPLKDDTNENTAVFRCFKLIYIQARDIFVQQLERILAIAVHVLYKKEYQDNETYENALGLLNEIRENYTPQFNAVCESNPEMVTFLQTL